MKIIAGSLIFLAIFLFVDGFWGIADVSEKNFVVVDKQYIPSEASTGVGYGVTSNGQSGVFIANSYRSEKFSVLLKINGGVRSTKASGLRFAQLQIGDTVRIITVRGCISKWPYNDEVM